MKQVIGRSVCYLYSAFALFFSIAPIFVYGVFGAGSILLLISGIFFFFFPTLIGYAKQKGGQIRMGLRVLITLVIIGVVTCGAMITAMLYTAHGKGYDPKNPPQTVVVLGCQVRGTEPSLMLIRRLEAAYEYLIQYPSSVCIVSGGQGEDEDLPEGEAMEQYLVEKGIDPQRIYKETESVNTKENFLYSTKIIREEGLSTQIVVATDGFHQFRASMFAKDNGLTFHALPANTPWLLAPCYYARELMGVVKSALFDRT